jgi:hypothetical protein
MQIEFWWVKSSHFKDGGGRHVLLKCMLEKWLVRRGGGAELTQNHVQRQIVVVYFLFHIFNI